MNKWEELKKKIRLHIKATEILLESEVSEGGEWVGRYSSMIDIYMQTLRSMNDLDKEEAEEEIKKQKQTLDLI